MVIISNRILEGKITIQSRLEEIELIDQEIEAWLGQLGINSSLAYNIGLAVHEAVVNAIKHGNKLQAVKQVEIKYGLVGGEMVFEVQDEGSGFDVNKLPDPLAPENKWKESGRGIFLMKEFMDKIEFEKYNDGFQVTLWRKLPNSPRTEHKNG